MDEPQFPGADRSASPAPPPLVVACGVVLVEALVLAGYAVAVVARITQEHLAVNLTTAGFFLIAAAGLGYCAWGLSRLRSWGRGPVLLAQLIALGLAYNFGSGGTWGVAIGLAVPALVALAGMVHPATIEALEYGADDS